MPILLGFAAGLSHAVTFPDGFQQAQAFSGLVLPVKLRFAPDGRVFVAEKGGAIRVFNGPGDTTPDTLVDLSLSVHDFWDRGLLGLAVDADFPLEPYVYVLYSFNFDATDPGAGVPRWPDDCPDPPGATADGCVINSRLSRLEVAPDNSLVGGETVLLENRWCQQFPSHSVGDLVFSDHERALYASAGDGASFNYVDHGQTNNPCLDPVDEGGALRSQDIRTAGDDVSLDGTVIALDPATGAPLPTNPLIGGDPGDDLIIATGLRNPYRMTYRHGTHEIWIGDVGWGDWEEINRIRDTEDGVVENFGWPCYEGLDRQPGYDGQDLPICETLYGEANAVTAPRYTYRHDNPVDPDPNPFRCSLTGNSAISGLAFYETGDYPDVYDDALFFADYARRCLFVMFPDVNGDPDPQTRTTFADDAAYPVDLQVGPDGLLYYVDIGGGRIMRIDYFSTNTPPVAVARADVTDGPLTLAVQFDGSQSTDADAGDNLTYAWDLDGDGQFDDSTDVGPGFAYAVQGVYIVKLEVTDESGDKDVDTIVITAGNRAPQVTILTPAATDSWHVGEQIVFSGQAIDPDDGPLPASSMRWDILLEHCPGGGCHTHFLQQLDGVAQGAFSAPDHEWYSFLRVVLTVSDSGFAGGAGGVLTVSREVAIDPRTVDLTFGSDPAGLALTIGGDLEATPFARTVITGSTNTIAAPSPQDLDGAQYSFVGWADGGTQFRTVVADAPAAFSATYRYDGIASNWWEREWRSRIKWTIDSGAQTGGLVDFPLLVTLDPECMDYASVASGAADLRFVDADGVTLLSHEIEQWTSGGTSRVWVNVPHVAGAAVEDFIWIYFDNPAAVDIQDPPGVWNPGYVGVWHLDDELLDSTLFGNHGTNHGSTNASGRIGGGRAFNGESWIDVGNDASLGLALELTVEAWIRVNDPDQPGAPRVLSKKLTWDAAAGFNLEYKPGDNNVTHSSSGSDYGRADGVDLDTNWHHLVATTSGTTSTIYVDGLDVTTDSTCDALVASQEALHLGRSAGGFAYWNGSLDEVRISNVARSADWVAAQLRSMTGAFGSCQAVERNCAPLDATCDGWDDDCDTLIDEDAVAPDGASVLMLSATDLVWSALPNASGYDVLRGDLATLWVTADLGQSVEACLETEHPGPSTPHGGEPSAANGMWFLVRGVNCGGKGTFDVEEPSQAGPRDAIIESSPSSCP